jgi:catechol 2,3-dioxygenase-like lactoylglutathione lyase family enzyme
MAVLRVDHIGIVTTNPEPVVEFYEKHLGFKLQSKRELPEKGLVIFDLEAKGEKIEILKPVSLDIRMGSGVKHIAFESDNIEEDFRILKEEGAEIMHKTVQHHDNVRFFFIKSPSGEFVEFIQRVS